MSAISLSLTSKSAIQKPESDKSLKLFFDLDGVLKFKNSQGQVVKVGGADAVVINEEASKLTADYDFFGINASNNQKDFNTKVYEYVQALAGNVPHPTYNNAVLNINTLPATTYEVGVQVTVTINGVFVKNDAGDPLTSGIKKGSSTVSPTLSFSEVIPQMPNSTITYQAFVNHDIGLVKNNAIGVPDPVGRIPAGTVNSLIRSMSGVYPIFYGSINVSDDIDDIVLSSLTKNVVNSNGTISLNFSNIVGKRLVVLVPSESALKTKWYVNALNNGNIGNVGDLFDAGVLRNFTSPNAYWSAKSYRVYISTPTNINAPMELRNN